jgi:heterotetrameric sarcosine oxidase gamma subunit
MERQAIAAGGRLERRDGWNVAAAFDGEEAERERCRLGVGFADVSHLGKVELQAPPAELAAIATECSDDARWCTYTAERAIAICQPGSLAPLRQRMETLATTASVVDVTCVWAALTIVGPLARELFARFTAIDLRPDITPTGAFRPGSVARTPGAILREDEQRYLMVFGAALGQYMWTVVADAAERLGGGPIGVDVLARADQPVFDHA